MHKFKSSKTLVQLVRQDGVLLCAVSGCAEALGSPLVPVANGWKLVDGWWFCPSHISMGTGE